MRESQHVCCPLDKNKASDVSASADEKNQRKNILSSFQFRIFRRGRIFGQNKVSHPSIRRVARDTAKPRTKRSRFLFKTSPSSKISVSSIVFLRSSHLLIHPFSKFPQSEPAASLGIRTIFKSLFIYSIFGSGCFLFSSCFQERRRRQGLVSKHPSF